MNDETATVFLVDDDLSILRALTRLLRVGGHQVSAFRSPRDFLAQHDAAVPGCVVLDLAMPGLNGLDVQERLARSKNPVPVVFITAHDDPGVREKALGAGAVAFLRKPFNDELFIKTVGEAIKRAPAPV